MGATAAEWLSQETNQVVLTVLAGLLRELLSVSVLSSGSLPTPSSVMHPLSSYLNKPETKETSWIASGSLCSVQQHSLGSTPRDPPVLLPLAGHAAVSLPHTASGGSC